MEVFFVYTRLKYILLSLILLSLFGVAAQADSVLTLPSGTTVVEAQAFMGDTSLGHVKLPEGLLRIESQAFAESSITAINLPASLTFIAEDAFQNCGQLQTVTVQEGTYAYTRAYEIGLFDLRALISGSVKEAVAGESITWTAKAMNGVSPYKYLFEVYRDGEKIDSRSYTADASYTYQFTRAGEYYAIVKIKDDDGNLASAKSAAVTVTANTPVIESVNCNLSEIKTMEEVRWTVSVKKGTVPYAYAFALNKGDALIAESENETGEYSFIFEEAGDYILSVTVTDAYQESASCILPFSVALTSVSIQNISCSHESLVAETAITWTVNATAGVKPYAYSYEILSGSEVLFAAADQTANTCSYTFETAGEYTLSVAVTDAEGNTVTSTRALSVAPRALEIVSVDYQRTVELGNALTWTVNAVGGDKPLRYAFDLYKDGEEIDGAAFGESNSFTFTPAAAGKYSVRIRVRDQRNTTVEMTGCETNVYIATAEEYFTYSVYSGNAYITKYTGTDAEVYIPATLGGYPVMKIYSCAFEYNVALTNVLIPEGITYIGEYAFRGCRNLQSIRIPDSVTSISSSTFSNCLNLKTVVLPENLTSIGSYAFVSCSSLEGITIPEGVTSIGSYAFNGCKKLSYVDLPGSLTSVGEGAFSYCTELTDVTIAEGVSYIGTEMFRDCDGLTNVIVPGSVKHIYGRAFSLCSNLETITLSYGLESIRDSAFNNCSSLISVTIPDSVTTIGKNVFTWCGNLTSVTVPDSVVNIGEDAFANSKKLIVYCHEGSYTHTYCQDNGINFILIKE